MRAPTLRARHRAPRVWSLSGESNPVHHFGRVGHSHSVRQTFCGPGAANLGEQASPRPAMSPHWYPTLESNQGRRPYQGRMLPPNEWGKNDSIFKVRTVPRVHDPPAPVPPEGFEPPSHWV